MAKVNSEYRKMAKVTKIFVNNKLIDYAGFNESSSLISLSVARSNVKLPVLNLSYKNLLKLDASFNGLEKIDDIGNETFPSLRLFNLSHNALTSAKSHIINHLKELEILDLSHNCFVRFHYDQMFLKHETLKKLYLNNNRLHSVQATLSEPKIMALDVLDFSNNFITEFSNFEIQIKHLNMRNNLLKSVNIFHASNMFLHAQHNEMVHFFAPSGTFRYLNLSHNEFEFLSYVEVERAIILDISHNHLRLWHPDDISGEILDVDTNEILVSESDENLYDKNTIKKKLQEKVGVRVTSLDLSYNSIDSIDVLRHYKECVLLNLASNKLSSIYPPEFHNVLPGLGEVNLRNNSLTESDVLKLERFNNELSDQLQLKFVYKPPPEPQASTLFPPHALISIPPIPTLPPHFFAALTARAKMIEMSTTPARSSPYQTTSQAPQTESTTQTKSIIVTTGVQPPANLSESEESAEIVDDNSPPPLDGKSFSAWTLAIVFSAIIVSSIIYVVLSQQKRGVRIIYRSYHEAENAL